MCGCDHRDIDYWHVGMPFMLSALEIDQMSAENIVYMLHTMHI